MESYSRAEILSNFASLAWKTAQLIDRVIPQGRSPWPLWAPTRMPKSFQRLSPPLGLPRVTDSLCPKCNTEIKKAIVQGNAPVSALKTAPGVIKAEILEENGRVLIRKRCEEHGLFEDVISTNPDFFRRLETLYRGRDFTCVGDGQVHDHGVSKIRSGRGFLLLVDLTNRCSMKCYPCFMNANNVGYVHELEISDIRAIFDRALSFKPRREVNILFTGGEPTISPIFLDAIRYARSLGFKRLHVATNGIRFAQSREFAQEAREAGLHGVYLQFDGVSEHKNRHRGVSNLFEIKLQALENIAAAGMRATLQSTVIRGINNDDIGSIMEFAIENIDKIHSVLFQPIMFAGRDQNIDPKTRAARRYTLSQLAEDLRLQCARNWQPMRDWFPISYFGACSNFIDAMWKREAQEGALLPDGHPDWSMSSALVVNRKTKEWMPLSSFFDFEQFVHDLDAIVDSARSKPFMAAQLRLAFLRNFNWQRAPRDFTVSDAFGLFDQTSSRLNSASSDWTRRAYSDDLWALLIVSGMWFDDLWEYDLQAIEMSPTPVATQEGEIDFSAYNAAGWREVVEYMNQRVPLSDWEKIHGRDVIFAGGKSVPLDEASDQIAVLENTVFIER
jgi:7,8-dihydro-6-hydroxymethylpterin dimethyltransferase